VSGLISSSGFANQTITFLNRVTTVDESYRPTVTWNEGSSFKACVYSKTLASGFQNQGLWKESTVYVAMIDYTSEDLDVNARIRFNGKDYGIDYIDDVAFQHDAIFIGLRTLQ